MSTATLDPPAGGEVAEPRLYRWTRDEYYKAAEAGLFFGRRVELIEGQIFEMSAIYGPHATAVRLADEAVRAAFGKGWVIRLQNPLASGEASDPEPDVAVVAGQIRDFTDEHPKSAALVIEVADSSLAHDRRHKGSLYAKAGIADYWIINLPDKQLEVHHDPQPDPKAEYGFSYKDVQTFTAGQTVSPLAEPKAVIKVSDLLP